MDSLEKRRGRARLHCADLSMIVASFVLMAAASSGADGEEMLGVNPQHTLGTRPGHPRPGALRLETAGWPALDALVAHDVFVGFFDLREWRPWLADAEGILAPDEAMRVARRRVADDRVALTLAYALHRTLLGHAMHCEPSQVPLGRTDAGGPSLSGCDLHTSLSHAGTRGAAIAVSCRGPLGVDLEPAARAQAMEELCGWVCHRHEEGAIAALPRESRGPALLALWVRKEAFLKAAGTGLGQEMHTFVAPEGAMLPLPRGGVCRVAMLDAGPEWVAAVAGAPGTTVTSTWVRPQLATTASVMHTSRMHKPS